MNINSVSAAGFGHLAPVMATDEPAIVAAETCVDDAAMVEDYQAAFDDFFARILASFNFLSMLSIRGQFMDVMRHDRVSDDLRTSERAIERDRLIALRAAQARDIVAELAEKAAIEAQMLAQMERGNA